MSYKIISNFIKDISFEIPDAETMLFFEKNISSYIVMIDLKAKPLKDNIIQVELGFKFENPNIIKNKVLVEITYVSLVTVEIDNKEDKKVLEKIILIDVPKEIYPNVFDIFSFLIKKSGLQEMNVKKDIDFEKLYNERKN